jgi:hypothetical protein
MTTLQDVPDKVMADALYNQHYKGTLDRMEFDRRITGTAIQTTPDNVKADALYNEYYKDKLDRAEFDRRMGISTTPMEEVASLPRQAMDMVSGAASAVGDFATDIWTGDKHREFDYPELPGIMQEASPTGEGMVGERMSYSRDDIGKLNIASKMGLAEKAGIDQFGNAHITLPQHLMQKYGVKSPGPYYLNRPGASMQDYRDLTTEGMMSATMAIPGARTGKALLGPLGRIAGGGGGAFGGSVAQDLLANLSGSERPVDYGRATFAGLFGAGGEVAGMALGKFLAMFSRSPKLMGKDGMPTEEGKTVLKRLLGDAYDEEAVFTRDFWDNIGKAGDPEAAKAMSEGLPTPVRMSKGDLSRDVTQQSFEDSALKGSVGTDRSKAAMQGFREGQNADLWANVEGIQKRLSDGQQPLQHAPDAVGPAREVMQGQKAGLKAKMTAAYEGGKGASVRRGDLVEVWSMIDDAMLEFPADIAPKAASRLEAIKKLSSVGKSDDVVSFTEMENWRKALGHATTGAYKSLDSGADKAALPRMKAIYDKWLDDAVDRAIVSGDPKALASLKKARGLRREIAVRFQESKIVAKFMDDKVTPTEALNELFSASGLGFKKEAAKAIKTLSKNLGPDSPEFRRIKEAAFVRLLESQKRGNNLGREMQALFSGDKYMSALKNAMLKNREVMTTLFDASELGLLQQFGAVSQRATNRMSGAVNYSNSAEKLGQLMSQMMGRGMISDYGRAALSKFLGFLESGRAAQNVGEAISGITPPRPGIIPPGVGATIGGTVAPNDTQY